MEQNVPLVRRFSESFEEEAGAHFTSRDIIYLMTDLLLCNADLSKGGNVTVYDMTMGTSQMLSCMEERIHELNSDIEVNCFDKLISEKEDLIKELESYKKSLIYEYVTGKKEVLVENVR